MQKRMRTLMGLWNCTCGKKRIRGNIKTCPMCNDPRNPTLTPSEKPYLPDNAEEVPDHVNVGPDWNCNSCGGANRGNATVCESCGKQHDGHDSVNPTIQYKDGIDARGVEFDNPQQINDDRVDDIIGNPLDEALKTVSGEIDQPRKSRVYTLPRTALNKTGQAVTRTREHHAERKEKLTLLEHWSLNLVEVVVAGAVLLLIGVGLLAFYDNFIRTEPKPLTVTSLSWERRMEVEELKTFHESDWSVPSGGRETRHYRAVHHYNTVVDHYETVTHPNPVRVSDGFKNERVACGSTTTDNGDGTFDVETTYCDVPVEQFHTENQPYTTQEPVYRRDPVYRTKYDYDIDRWVTDRWITTSGEAGGIHPQPYYPEDVELQARERAGDEREGTYEVNLEGEGHTYTRNVELNIWDNLELDEGLVGHITKRGALRQIDWPEE